MATQTGSVVQSGGDYHFDNDDGTVRQRLSTGGLGGSRPHTDPINTIHLAAFPMDAVRRYKARLIRLALKETGGKVTAAARILGFRHHQSLIALIESRHKDAPRSPVRKRRKHLMAHPKRKKKSQ